MSKSFQWLGLAGAVIWASAVLLRSIGGFSGPLAYAIGIAPNFGAAWSLMGIYCLYLPYVFKRDTTRNGRYLAICAILALLLLSELVHYFFLGAGFDWADLAATAVATLVLAIVNHATSKTTKIFTES